MPFSSPQTADVDPEISPDQSFLVFASSGRRDANDTKEHLYIVFQHNGAWGNIIPIRYQGDDDFGSSNDNEPNIARTPTQAQADLARLELWDNGNTHVWTMSLAPWLE